jgi:hypothetical protein
MIMLFIILVVLLILVLPSLASETAEENEIRLKREAEENEIRLKREAEENAKKLEHRRFMIYRIVVSFICGLIGVIVFGFISYLFSELWMYFSGGIAVISWIDSCGIIGFILGIIFSHKTIYFRGDSIYTNAGDSILYMIKTKQVFFALFLLIIITYKIAFNCVLYMVHGNKIKQAFVSLFLLIIIIVGRIQIVNRYKELTMYKLIRDISAVFYGLLNWLSGIFHGLYYWSYHWLSEFFHWLYFVFRWLYPLFHWLSNFFN